MNQFGKTASNRNLSLASRVFVGPMVLLVLVVIWKLGVLIFDPPHFLFPAPERVFSTMLEHSGYLAEHALVTMSEMLLGLLIGGILGVAIALLLSLFPLLDRFLMPVVVTTQTLPVFAIAPLLVIWFGFGIGSKIVMASLIIFFPVTSAFYDGLKSTNREWLDLSATWGATPLQMLMRVRIPAALPSLATGLKVAATVAPIGAVVGEWAGAASGLGYLMLQANARMQTDMVFAALVVLALSAYLLRWVVSAGCDRLVFWSGEAGT